MIKLLSVLFLGCTVFACTAKDCLIKEWKFDNSADLKKVRFSVSSQNNYRYKISEEVKTPDGDLCLELIMKSSSKGAPAHAKQINFDINTILAKNSTYRVVFWCKGSVKGKLVAIAAQAVAPYKGLGKTAQKVILIEDKWQKITIDFISSENWNCKIAVPRFMPGFYPVGGKIYLGPVRFSILKKHIPLTINQQWLVFPLAKEKYSAASFKKIPGKLDGVEAVKVKMTNQGIDLAKLFGGVKEKKPSLLFNEFESPAVGQMQIGCAADWWMDIAVNGKRVYNTLKSGNISNKFNLHDHVFNFPVKKGRNLMVVKVISGSAGWKFIAGKIPFCGQPGNLQKIIAGKEWKPLNMKKICVKSRSALDFSSLRNTGVPAGKFGSVSINKRGQLAFKQAPDKRVRFFGLNSWSAGYIALWTKPDIKEFAESMANQGYNIIRIQAVNLIIIGGIERWKRRKEMRKLEVAVKDPVIHLDHEVVDKFDYLLSCLREKGVYYNIDIMSYGTGSCMTMPHSYSSEKSFKTQLLFNPVYRKHWKKVASFILNHQNPYTGIALKDDPALICVEPFNEQDLLLYNKDANRELTLHFREFLKNKYHNSDRLATAWNKKNLTFNTIPDISEAMLRKGDTTAGDAGKFLVKIMSNTTDWYFQTLRKIGYKGIISQWDMIMRMMEMPVRAKMPLIAQHGYFAHPNRVPTKGLIKKSSNNDFFNMKKFDSKIRQGSSLNSSFFRASAAVRFVDRPFLMTEYSHSFFNQYRHERGLFFGSYAALQDWDGLFCHGQAVPSKYWSKYPVLSFENGMDPISRASEVVTALAWMRGDVSKAKHLVAFKLKDKEIFPKHILTAVGDDYAKLSMLTGIGLTYPEIKPLMPVGKSSADLTLELKEFSKLNIKRWYASASSKDGKVFPELLNKLKKSGIIDNSNITDYDKRIFQSDTGEITLYSKNETMTVITPNLEGAVIKKSKSIKLDSMEIHSTSKPCSITLASIEKGKNIKKAKRLLFVLSTNALNSNMVLAHNGCLMLDIGNLPVLMESVQVKVSFNTSNLNKPMIYALNMDGTRAEAVSCSLTEGKVYIALDTSKLKYGTPFFEIIF